MRSRILILPICLFATPVWSQAIECSTIVDETLFNKKSVKVSELIIANMKADVCSKDFESRGAASSYMRDGGWNLDVFGYFDNSLVDSKQEETGSYEVTRSEFCNKSSSELTQTLGVDFLETNGEFAFDAFKQCVEETNSNVTALSYEFVGGGAGQLIAGELSRFINGQQQNLPYELYGFAVTPASANVECTFLAEGIPDGLSRDTPVEI